MDPSDTLVLGRAKRSTAGNRLRALLDKAHTLNAEEGFEEVENDQDFEDLVEQKDVFDDDFASTDDEARGDDVDPTVLEKRLRKEERTQNQKEKRRNYHDPLAYLKKGPKATKVVTAAPKPPRVANENDEVISDDEERDPKRRKVSFSEPVDDEGVAVASSDESGNEDAPQAGTSTRRRGLGRKTAQGEVRRSVLRASTRKDRDEVDERAQEEQARKAIHPVRGPRKPHPNVQLTQADLIALALEREEENRESLKDWLKKEEERRLKSKEGRKVVEGPRIRWVSRIEGLKLVEISTQLEGSEDVDQTIARPVRSQFEIDNERAKESLVQLPSFEEPPAPEVKPPAYLKGVPSIISLVDSPEASSSTSNSPAVGVKSDVPAGMASQPEKQQPITTLAKGCEGDEQPLPLIKNYLILEEIAGGPKREMEVILGHHADWTRMPVVSIRNRMQTRRRPICPLSGRPASYRDPLTYIPFATVDAYRVIGNITRGKYRWSNETNVYLDEDGLDRPTAELEVAEGLMDEVDGWAQAVGWDSPHSAEEPDAYERPSSVIQEVPSEVPQALENHDTDEGAHPAKPDLKGIARAGVKRKLPRQRGSSRAVA